MQRFNRREFLISAGAAVGATALLHTGAATAAALEGNVEPRFEAVRLAFADNFAFRNEVGAAVAVYHRGRKVVDLWGGVANVSTGAAWQSNSMALWQSCTKGFTSTVLHLMSQRGQINLNAPVCHYWPEFAAAGKAGITVAQVMAHTAGVVVIDNPPQLFRADVIAWQPLIDALAAQAPAWTPGTSHGYHVQNFGFILDEIVRRVAGQTLGQYLTSEIAQPLGLDLWIGLPAEEFPRLAPTVPPVPPDPNNLPTDPRLIAFYAALADPNSLLYRATRNPIGALSFEDQNSLEYAMTSFPSSNGIATSRSVARLYASLIGPVDGARLLNPITINSAIFPRSSGFDAVIPAVTSSWGLGYAKRSDLNWFPNNFCFGHNGAGGSMAFADPFNQIAFAYQPNNLILDYNLPRGKALIQAVYGSLGLPVFA